MTDVIHRLIYYSRNLVRGSDEELRAEVDAILDASRRNNAEAGVTGALIFNRGVFAQVLEGPRRSIEETFERIQRDERHSDVQVLAFDAVDHRGFPSWSMAFLGRSLDGEEAFGHIALDSGFDEKRLEGERIYEVMRRIALEDEMRPA
jgi:hypothetical protein